MNNILREYLNRFCIAYLDNILIFSNNEKEYGGYILLIFKTLQKAGLRIKPEKYKFHIQEIKYLGFIIIPDRLYIDPAKI